MTNAADEEHQRQERDAAREGDFKAVPPQTIDKTKWPAGVREISIAETGGLGIDRDGRLHWNGKPVEIIGRRLDLTKPQFFIAAVVAIATLIGALAACVQSWAAYHDWACKVNWPVWAACPPKPIPQFFRNDNPLLRND